MTNNTLIARLLAAIKAGPSQNYEFEDQYGDTQVVLTKDYEKPEKLEVFDESELSDLISSSVDEVEDTDGNYWDSFDAYTLKAIRDTLNNPKILYHVVDIDGGEYNFTPAAYKAIKRQVAPAYRFQAAGYEVVVTQGDLAIGCQKHSLEYWKNNIDRILDVNYMNTGTHAEDFRTALPYLEKMQATLAGKKKAKKPAKKAAKKKTAKRKK